MFRNTSAQRMSGLHVFFKHSFSGIRVALFWVQLNVTMPGRCHFNEKWLEKDAYKSWLRKDDKNSNKASCFAWNKSIDLHVHCNGKVGLPEPYERQDAQRIRKNLQGNEKTTKTQMLTETFFLVLR